MTEAQIQPIPTSDVPPSTDPEVAKTVEILRGATEGDKAPPIKETIAVMKVAAEHHTPGPAED